jgi:hypothetical protein
MKWLLLFLLTILYSCQGNFSARLSHDQQSLYRLAGNFAKKYKDTNESAARDKLVMQEQIRLQAHLRDVCNDSLDQMKVQLRKLEIKPGGHLLAEFTDNNCRYFFHQTYPGENEMKADTIYQMLASLKKDTDITMRFLCTGNVKVNTVDNGDKLFEIAVIPTAIEVQTL